MLNWHGSASGSIVVGSGGVEVVFGTANATTVSSGGLQLVASGGVVSGTTVSSGGEEYIVSGGSASGSIVDSGGLEVVFGTASGTTLSGGGAEVVASGGVVSGSVSFVSGGTLFVNDGMHFSGTLVGFNSTTDVLDLVNVPYLGSATVLSYTSTGVQSGTNIGTLSVVNSGGVVANIALLGNYIAGSADFVATSDGHGGTIITDPPIAVATDQQSFLTEPKHA